MNYVIHEKDYLELWKYYQDKAISVKGAMFKTITWLIGFAAALLAFIMDKLIHFPSSNTEVSIQVLISIVSIAGIVICIFGRVALKESDMRISKYWEYANNCRVNIENPNDIILENDAEKTASVVIRLRRIVWFFLIAFGFVLVWVWVLSKLFKA